jgi:hypothetical protein
MWLNLFVDDYHLSNIAKVIFLVFNHIGGKKNLQLLKKWTYVLHTKNNIIKVLIKSFLNPLY